MSSSANEPDSGGTGRGRMFWLPPDGFGNGVDAENWAELADLPEDEVAAALFALAEAHIAGYVARPHPRAHQTAGPLRLWVDSLHYGAAEDVLMIELAQIHGRRPPRPH